jgi:site-specific DNA-methyltransferase (adenine-specific)
MIVANTVHLGDCLDVMADIAPKSIDMILCDLPYGTTACKWDVIIPFEPLWAHYKRIIKDRGAIVLTASQPFTSMLVMSNREWFKYCWVWDKALPTGHLNAKRRPMRQHEDIVIFSDGNNSYNPEMRTGIFRKKGDSGQSECYGKFNRTVSYNDQYYPTSIIKISNANQTDKLHPTQKPIALFEYLIRTYTNPGDLVLDNCAGSGTTAIAAINTGRDYILIEKEPKYFEIINKRIAEHAAQPMIEGMAQ